MAVLNFFVFFFQKRLLLITNCNWYLIKSQMLSNEGEEIQYDKTEITHGSQEPCQRQYLKFKD